MAGVKKGNIPWNKGLTGAQVAWNKGLTKDDPRVARAALKPKDRAYSQQQSNNMKSIWSKRRETGEYEQVCKNMSMNYNHREYTKETRTKISISNMRAYAEGRRTPAPHAYKHVMKGQFKPINPQKYKGDINNIIYRSSWELKMMVNIDKNPNVLSWSSEEVRIPYRNPVDNIIHTYFPDFWVEHMEKGKVKQTVYEVKPKAQTKPPEPQKKMTKKYLKEVFTWGINEAKWKSAVLYCKNKGWEFKIINEHDLGIKYGR